MEAYFMTRGKKEEVDTLIDWLRTRGLPMPIKNTDGTVTQTIIECQIRPIQLWDFVFPKESLDVVCNSLKLPHGDSPYGKADGTKVDYNINPKL